MAFLSAEARREFDKASSISRVVRLVSPERLIVLDRKALRNKSRTDEVTSLLSSALARSASDAVLNVRRSLVYFKVSCPW